MTKGGGEILVQLVGLQRTTSGFATSEREADAAEPSLSGAERCFPRELAHGGSRRYIESWHERGAKTEPNFGACGRSSVVERQLPKLNVVGSIPIARSKFFRPLPLPRRNVRLGSEAVISSRGTAQPLGHKRHPEAGRGWDGRRACRGAAAAPVFQCPAAAPPFEGAGTSDRSRHAGVAPGLRSE
jgi:hypothetical protein